MPMKTSTPGLQWQTNRGNRQAWWFPTKKGSGASCQMLWCGKEPTQDDIDRISGACMRLYLAFREKVGPPRVRARKGQIYFARCGDLVKIGYTTNFSQRLETLQVQCPQKIEALLVIAGSLAEEKALHRQFAACRTTGEWFTLTDEIRALIDERSKVVEAA